MPRRWPLLALRTTTIAVAVLALVQPVLAGGFLQGYYPLLKAHQIAAMILATFVLLSVVAALLAWRLSGVLARIAVLYAVLLVLCAAQITLGFSRVLLIHIPLGVAIFALCEKFAVDAWKAGATA
ncbi:hypothetical protein [Kitasatospora sp. NBC_01266]|uniref:hypothetical protein n=1 Tax=Kitasatospora sp. NBC_01266 TaxID=2903572 RepID=UPI002E3091C1|nr:hypothetical protein [Kitasatospora sp. NBC_01266]